jgi:hypothetical protein
LRHVGKNRLAVGLLFVNLDFLIVHPICSTDMLRQFKTAPGLRDWR